MGQKRQKEATRGLKRPKRPKERSICFRVSTRQDGVAKMETTQADWRRKEEVVSEVLQKNIGQSKKSKI